MKRTFHFKKIGTQLFATALSILVGLGSIAACAEDTGDQPTTSDDSQVSEQTNDQSNTEKDEVVGGKTHWTVTIVGGTLEDGLNPATKRTSEGWNTYKDNQLAEKFPDLEFTLVAIPWDNASAKMQTTLLSKETDLFTSGGAFMPEYYKEGLILGLNDLIDNDDNFVYEDEYPENFKSNLNCTDYSGEELITLPWDVGYRTIIYDKQIFDDWGVEHLSEYPTPEEILEKAAQMTGENPVTGKKNYGLYFAGNTLNMSYIIPLSEYFNATEVEGSFGDPANLKWNLNSPEFIETIEYVIEASQYVPEAATTGQGNENFGTHDNVNAIVIDTNGGPVTNEVRNTGDETLLDRFEPTMHVGNNGGNWTPIDGMAIASHISEEDHETAWEILKFLAGPETKSWDFENYGPKAIGHNISAELYGDDKYLQMNGRVMAEATHPGYEINPFYGSTIQPTFASMISRAIAGEDVDVTAELNELQDKAESWSAAR